MTRDTRQSLFAAQLDSVVEQWSAHLPSHLRAHFREDMKRFGVLHDTALNTLEGILERSARAHAVDAPTGLATRRPFHDYLATLLAASSRPESAVVGVLFIDLDKLKQINDSRGHHIGDRALAAIGSIVREAVRVDRGMDLVARRPEAECAVGRHGGDEFVVALGLSDSGELERVARRIKRRADDPHLQRTHGYLGPPDLSVSIGGVAFEPSPNGLAAATNSIATALVAAADALMYQSKRDGHVHIACARFGEGLEVHDQRRLPQETLAPSPAEP